MLGMETMHLSLRCTDIALLIVTVHVCVDFLKETRAIPFFLDLRHNIPFIE